MESGWPGLSPKAFVNFDSTYNQLADSVNVFEKKDGIPVGVMVTEPEDNGLEREYTFVRGRLRCLKYIRKKQSDLSGLGAG